MAPPTADISLVTIPNTYHFIFGLAADFGGKPFSFIHYLALLTCRVVNNPTKITLYCSHEPTGVWWERAKPLVDLVTVRSPEAVFGNPIIHPAHKADVLRLEILLSQGGVYLDMDVLCLRPLDRLFSFEVVMGEEEGVGLCNAVILAQSEATFLNRWLTEYRTFRATNWNLHSVIIPARLAREFPELITVLDHRKFFSPPPSKADLLWFFLHPGSKFSHESYCVHLWESVTWPHIGRLDPWLCFCIDSEFTSIVGPHIELEWILPDELNDGLRRTALEALSELRVALGKMSPQCREVAILCLLQGLEASVAAPLLDQSLSDIKDNLVLVDRSVSTLIENVRRSTTRIHGGTRGYNT